MNEEGVKMSKSFEELISKANQNPKKVSVSNAQDEPVLQAVKAAKEQNIATAILVGDEAKIREIAASIDMDLTGFQNQSMSLIPKQLH